ncbi:MAG: GNAT family N-acetyltransferase [Anaerolineae bacterium]|nr:MAG: GNAT family N-acetyltransferase [Anaerolineae bacterium]
MNSESTLTDARLTTRPAVESDRNQLASLIHFETHVHRHLDWRPPLDWLGLSPYLIGEQNGRLLAALACPPDPPGVAWIRLFAVTRRETAAAAWRQMWPQAREQLAELPARCAAAIPLQDWFRELLLESGFEHAHNVVVLLWDNAQRDLPPVQAGCALRAMKADDLPAVQELDAAAFGEIWRNSLSTLELAFKGSALARVVEDEDGLLGYQISTHSPFGAHLARLAVHPRAQRRGIGYALVRDLQQHYEDPPLTRITVNTQDHNNLSLALYQKAGFRQTSEQYPVFQLDLE